jgi:hypothetical protein
LATCNSEELQRGTVIWQFPEQDIHNFAHICLTIARKLLKPRIQAFFAGYNSDGAIRMGGYAVCELRGLLG